MKSRLIETRPPTEAEKEARGGAVVFVREHPNRRRDVIHADRCYEGWQQWGADRDTLADNVPDVEAWRATLPDEPEDGDE